MILSKTLKNFKFQKSLRGLFNCKNHPSEIVTQSVRFNKYDNKIKSELIMTFSLADIVAQRKHVE